MGRRVAENVRLLRDARKLTTSGLAEQVSAHGVPMSPTTVTKIEKFSRRVTVDELATLAEVLDVAPAALLLPDDVDPVAEVARFAGRMLRGPFHLEVDADDEGVKSWTLGGGRERRPGNRAQVEAALRDVEGDDGAR